VGKSYIVTQFAQQHFKNFVTVNFELEPELISCFTSLNPIEIIKSIQVNTHQKIISGETLLFLDEIQECPRAIQSLRYFKENMPDLHVIGAGSLLEFALNDENFRMPVGRVEFLHLKPLSFQEFLIALNEESIVEYLNQITLTSTIQEAVHIKLLKRIREYWVLGGMPDVLQQYIEDNTALAECQHTQTVLLTKFIC